MRRVLVQARIDADLNDWVNDQFGRGFKQRFVEGCFKSLNIMIAEGRMPTPSDYARKATADTAVKIAKAQTQT